MNKKHYKYAIIISLFGLIFANSSQTDLNESVLIFTLSWHDLVLAIVGGIILGLLLRLRSVFEFINSFLGNKNIIYFGSGVIGIGAIGIGLVGSLIVYFKFNDLNLIQLPLHFAKIGIVLYITHLIIIRKKNEI